MGLFDTLKDMGNALGDVVNTAVNDYKEKKAYEAAELEMKESIAEAQYNYVYDYVEKTNNESLIRVMSLVIKSYDSFKKTGQADAFDLMEAIINGEDISSWASEYYNSSELENGYNDFYKDYIFGALDSTWYKETMVPFYEDEASAKLPPLLNAVLTMVLPDKAYDMIKDKYGDSIDGIRLFLEDKKYDFYNPYVAWVLSNFFDDNVDVTDNFDKYEKRCLKTYTNIVRNTRLSKCGLNTESKQIRLEGEKGNCAAGIIDNCFCYIPITFSDVRSIADLKQYTTLEATKIPLTDILYWKEYGEIKTEVGLKKQSAFIDAYGASKGVILPKQLEERKVDSRYIALVFENGQLDLDYVSIDTIKELLPQYAFDRVQVKKPEVKKPVEKVETKAVVEDSTNDDSDIVASFEKLEKLKSMHLISDEEYESKRAELMIKI